jgi:hypothetical protein
MIATVVTSSFATRWLGTWLPAGWTTRWYSAAWAEFQLGDVLSVTFQIVFLVVFLSGLIGVPAAYALARREFPGKKLVMLLFLLPLLVPPITFGIPLATVLYRLGLAGQMSGVVLANLVPTVPFVILVMIPFIEQIDTKIEAAARVFGANTFKLFIMCCCPADAGHPRLAAAGAGAHHRDVRADLPHRRADQPDAGGGALLRRLRRRRARRAVDRRDGGDLHGDDADLAHDRAALRQPDADRRAGRAALKTKRGAGAMPNATCRTGMNSRPRRALSKGADRGSNLQGDEP